MSNPGSRTRFCFDPGTSDCARGALVNACDCELLAEFETNSWYCCAPTRPKAFAGAGHKLANTPEITSALYK
jgi:hypothetical protein